MKHSSPSIARFARHILGKPLYPYQLEIAEAILASILDGKGSIFTVMMARQSGKNQLSAVLEAYLLACMPQGTIVKAAPTFTPQIITSRLRLLSLLDTPFTRDRIWTSNGYILGLAPTADPILLRNHAGPRIMFFSAGPESNVVGATADLLLEIDEAQDVLLEKFNRDFRPMAAVANATTILYGTAWTDHTLLAQQRAANLELEQRTGVRQHFEHDWRTLAAINPAYRTFVQQEIARLGEDHPAIQTQYFLRPISGAGYFLNELQKTLLQGTHAWEDAPDSDGCYIAGMDIAGEERPAPGTAIASDTLTHTSSAGSRRDSTVITIGRVYYNELDLPCINVVHHQWWTGRPYLEQYAAALALVERWNTRALVIDATGLGAGLASLLSNRLGQERVIPFTFTRPGKSRLAYTLLSLLNSGRLKLYAHNGAPPAIYEEVWKQLRQARYRLPAPEVLDIYVDPTDGHDDFLISLALLAEALQSLVSPATSTLIRPIRLYGDEGRF
ncbi:MAG TPA: hypothetical protein VKV20_08125 [Ktedonobacteraceae bacterium]|jgi:hypothetical protein|nr:hypothetical protein [Ktedonobacteraceae bacterium]